MNGIHDMGGMHGFGPIRRDAEAPVFHQTWEGRLFAIRQATPIPIPGGSRNNIENMPPADYLTTSYYERWLETLEKLIVAKGHCRRRRSRHQRLSMPVARTTTTMDTPTHTSTDGLLWRLSTPS